MKKIHFIIQSKGGCGKSMLTYLLALAKAKRKDCLFVDADGSTNTSTRQLKFLGENRLEKLSLLNPKKVLVRDILVTYLESLKDSPFQEIYFDFGAPESEQLPALIERDLPFKRYCDALDFQVHFHIIVAGGGAYLASIEYMQDILRVLKNEFQTTVWQNLMTFTNFENLGEELADNCENMNLDLRHYGDFEPNSNIGGQIIDNVRLGYGLDNYQLGPKFRMYAELEQNFSYELQDR